MSRLRSLVALGAAALATAVASPASAQEYLPAASGHVASGLEGAGRGFQRARTRIRLALELRIDEAPKDAFVGAVIADIEPHAAFGAELRYMRMLSTNIAVSGGAIGYFVPATLFGPSAGFEVRLPVGTKAQFVLGPEVAVFPLGSDLPDGSVIWQALLQGGFRVDL